MYFVNIHTKWISHILLLLKAMLLVVACNNGDSFDREIAFANGWEVISASPSSNTVLLSKKFDLQFDNDKIYLLQIDKSNRVSSLNLNNHKVIMGLYPDGTQYFNMTPFLNDGGISNELQMSLYSGWSNNEAISELTDGIDLVCVNKLYMPGMMYKSKSLLTNKRIDIIVRNSFDTERQAVLKYSYFNRNKTIEIFTTPVFISANSENLYQHTIEEEIADLTAIECELYTQGVLMDRHKVIIKP
ncbi:MAG: hypothetical protein MI866_04465 [Bacteroidales bacterium]|nr:hypothetical protein [Bacteroidales bacterium]